MLETGLMLELTGITKHFRTRQGVVRAVEGVSLAVRPRSTMAVVGESGCGKTTIAKMILQLEQPDAGTIRFEGQDIAAMDRLALRRYRRDVMAVFQDPYASLNPRLRVATIIAEPILAHERSDRAELAKRIAKCSTSSACRRPRHGSTRMNSPAGNASASPSPAPWPCGRA